MILARGHAYETEKSHLNGNVLVVGASGTGKTRGVAVPNLLEAEGSYIVSDPKGNLYKKYSSYLRLKGYAVKMLDLTHPDADDGAKFNFFRYIRSEHDIMRVAHLLVQREGSARSWDPFWDDSAVMLLASVIAYLNEFVDEESRTFSSILKLLPSGMCEDLEDAETPLDVLMRDAERRNPDSFAARLYSRFRIAANRTLRSVLITVFSTLCVYGTPAVERMLSGDTVGLDSIGTEKTALFVTVSDTDRSMDRLACIFFTMAMQELCWYADNFCADERLPVPVRFILDDFATNCVIADFPRMISSIRSRGISAMLMIQAESQLTACYGEDGRTIVGNCDSYVYMGGSDIETARAVSTRCDQPLQDILNLAPGKCWIIRRGERPAYADIASPETGCRSRKRSTVPAAKHQTAPSIGFA